jgi:integrase
MAYQQGCLRTVRRKAGDVWLLRYRTTKPDGTRVENTITVGPVSELKTESAAWREVDARGLRSEINAKVQTGRKTFEALAEHYLQKDFGKNTQASATTVPIVQHYVRDYLIPRWKGVIAEDIPPVEIEEWLASLNTRAENPLLRPTISKIKWIMGRVYRVGLKHQLLSKNPMEGVDSVDRFTAKHAYAAIKLTPEQTLAILQRMKNQGLHRALVLVCAATALRASELLALRWSDILWMENQIRVSKRWARGADGETKTEASDAYVPLHSLLAGHLREWKRQSPHAKDGDFVFPSLVANGRIPLSACSFVKDHLRPAAKAAGVAIPEGKRFGLHNLRHSLSSWLVTKAKIDIGTSQAILRDSDREMTLLYTQSDPTETCAAQGRYLDALGISEATICSKVGVA